ncbi:MAG: glycoside hydrolase family 3 N-terminal domain-containing protein [Xanthobacteraceae bacterium]
MKFLNVAFALARFILIAAMMPFAIGWRTPLFASSRYIALAALIILPLILIAFEFWMLRGTKAPQSSRSLRFISFATILFGAVAFGATATLEGQFLYKRHSVLGTDTRELERLGRHVLVGYRDPAMLHALIERRAAAGVFLSALNVEGKSVVMVGQEITALQDIRRQQNLDALWIATDQEGGAVSRLSPPLARMPALAEIVALHRDHAERQLAVAQYAARQGRELAAMGVNLNFAPVVDLNHGIVNPDDRLSRIASRAISSDPVVVTEVARLYCATLMMTGVHCTLKHFPGLGRVYDDTHRVTAQLDASAGELEASDWMPFRQLMSEDAAFTMLGHARLMALDKEHPASFSQAVVKGMLRENWKHDGVLITDDFSMGAVTLSREGAAGGAIEALNAGVDLVLVSYDPDQYFYIMDALLKADRDGQLRPEALQASDARLRRAAAAKPGNGSPPHSGDSAVNRTH